MYIKTNVPETYISNIIKGKNVEVFFPVLGKKLDAKINQTGSFINPDNRTYKVEIDVPNLEHTIKPNLTARLKINDYTNDKAILIPQNIISENAAGEQYIFILEQVKDNKAVAKQVFIKTGRTQAGFIEVLEGLEDGNKIIQEGARSVKNGQTVKIITY
jgi:multidrug efflux pump subunit AcrA (membrane-fusion protein)